MFMIENVEGLKNINKGQTLNYIVKKMTKLGYNVVYKVLNSVNYDVPQKRKRLIIIGTKYDVKFIYPKTNKKIITIKDALENVPKSDGYKYSDKKKKILKLIPPGGCWINLPIDIQKEYLGKSFYSGGGKRGIARRLSWDEPCLTLTTSPHQKQTERCHPDKTRPLTLREYARIQTFPDDFEFIGSISSIYKQIGNAVPCKLAYHIGDSIIHTLCEIYSKKYTLEYFLDIHNINKKIEKNKNNKINDKLNSSIMAKLLTKKIKKFIQKKIIPIISKETKLGKTDIVKKHMDMLCYDMNEEEWYKNEKIRIKDKQINNKIGELHEYIISELDGWENCKNSSDKYVKSCGLDVYKKDKSVFIEIKNKYNTLNSSSKKETIDKLQKIKDKYPDALCVIGIIYGSDMKKQVKDSEIWTYSGKEFYKLVYNDEKYYDDVVNILSKLCISDGLCKIRQNDFKIKKLK